MARGSNLFDQYADQLNLEKQVIQFGYETPADLQARKELEQAREEEK